MIERFENDLLGLQSQAPKGNVKVSIYVTQDSRAGGGSSELEPGEEKEVISGVKEQHHTSELDIHVVGRPDLPTLTRKESTSASSMAIAGLRHLTGCS